MSSGQPEIADDTKREQRQRPRRRAQAGIAIITACIGLFSFSSVAGNPRFETYHTLDVIRLMTAGGGFGVALVLLIQFFKHPGPRSADKKEKEQGAS
jgi:hypothetical protein